MQNLRYKIWSSFFIWSVNCIQVMWLPWWCHWYNSFIALTYLTKFEINIVPIEPQIGNLFLILFLVCKMYPSHVIKCWRHQWSSFVKRYVWCKFQIHTICGFWDTLGEGVMPLPTHPPNCFSYNEKQAVGRVKDTMRAYFYYRHTLF